MSYFQDLEKLLRLCPDITLSADDIQDIIDTKSINNCVAKHKNGGVSINPEPIGEPVIIDTEEDEDEELDEVEEVKTHINECNDEFCECKSCFDEIEEEI